MDIRQATIDDVGGIRDVARASLSATYDFLDGETVERAIDKWYSDARLEDAVSTSADVLLIGVHEGDIVAFSQSVILGEKGEDAVGEIRWLHVHPDHRERGIGNTLLDRTREVLRGQGINRIRGVVLAGNELGSNFYERHGFEKVGERHVTIGDEEHTENIYATGGGVGVPARGPVETHEVEGTTLYVFREEGERGSEGLFHPAYREREGENLWGWMCGACGSFDAAVDSMGRMECTQCGNVRKPTRWDAAYL